MEHVIEPGTKDPVIAWLENCRDFPGSTDHCRQLAAQALARITAVDRAVGFTAVGFTAAQTVVSRDQARAFLDVLVGRNFGEHVAWDKSPHVITHLRAVLGFECLPENLDVLSPWSADDVTKADRVLDYLAAVVEALRRALAEHKATNYPGPATAIAPDPDIPF